MQQVVNANYACTIFDGRLWFVIKKVVHPIDERYLILNDGQMRPY